MTGNFSARGEVIRICLHQDRDARSRRRSLALSDALRRTGTPPHQCAIRCMQDMKYGADRQNAVHTKADRNVKEQARADAGTNFPRELLHDQASLDAPKIGATLSHDEKSACWKIRISSDDAGSTKARGNHHKANAPGMVTAPAVPMALPHPKRTIHQRIHTRRPHTA